MKQRLFCFLVLFMFASSYVQAQKRNLAKINLTALPLKTYAFQYERVLNKHFSAAVSYRTMPSTGLPFRSSIVSAVGNDNADVKKTIEDFKLTNTAVTLEVRCYLNRKGFGRGFYLAPFYRHAHFATNSLPFDYEGNNVSGTINLRGDLSANTAGLAFGAQWFLGKHLLLDWWIFGPHYGTGDGDFEGVSTQPLTQEEQDDLKKTLDDIDIPLTKKTVNVTATTASMKLSGPWAGIRAGILLGVRF